MQRSIDSYLPKYADTHRVKNTKPIFGIHETVEDRLQDGETRQQKSRTLGDLEKDFVLFTVAPLILHRRIDRDLLQEFVARYPASVPEECVAIIDSERFLFFGFPKDEKAGVDYNRRLFAIAKKRWSLLANFVGSAAFFSRERRYYAKVYQQPVTIVDEFALRGRAVVVDVPTVVVQVFGVSSTENHMTVVPAVFPQLPRFKVLPPAMDVVATGEKLFGKIV